VKAYGFQQASNSGSVTNWVLRRPGEMLYVCITVVSRIPASFDYFLVKKYLAAFTIVRGQYQDSAKALHMLSVMVWLQSYLFEG